MEKKDFLHIIKSGKKNPSNIFPNKEKVTHMTNMKNGQKKTTMIYHQAILLICMVILGWLAYLTFSGFQHNYNAIRKDNKEGLMKKLIADLLQANHHSNNNTDYERNRRNLDAQARGESQLQYTSQGQNIQNQDYIYRGQYQYQNPTNLPPISCPNSDNGCPLEQVLENGHVGQQWQHCYFDPCETITHGHPSNPGENSGFACISVDYAVPQYKFCCNVTSKATTDLPPCRRPEIIHNMQADTPITHTNIETPASTCFEENKVYRGHPIGGQGNNLKTNIPTAAACQVECQNTEGCTWFNWNSNEVCFVKSGQGEEMTRQGYVTGPASCDFEYSDISN